MKKYLTILPFKLSLFDEGVGTGDGGATTEGLGIAEKSGGKQAVVYGKQEPQDAPAAEEKQEEVEQGESLEALRQRYDDFMNDSQMKQFFKDDTQKIINRRFKEQKTLEEQLAQQGNVLGKLFEKYNVQDVESLDKAIDADDELWDELALEKGMTGSQYRQYREMEQKIADANKIIEQNQRTQQARAQYAQWVREAQEIQAKYPEFNLDEELQNPNFRGLIGQKNPQYQISMMQAYEICHMDSIKSSIKAQTERMTEGRVVANVRARGSRPIEGAMRGSGAVVVKDDVSQLSKKDRAEIAKRVLRGEKIAF